MLCSIQFCMVAFVVSQAKATDPACNASQSCKTNQTEERDEQFLLQTAFRVNGTSTSEDTNQPVTGTAACFAHLETNQIHNAGRAWATEWAGDDCIDIDSKLRNKVSSAVIVSAPGCRFKLNSRRCADLSSSNHQLITANSYDLEIPSYWRCHRFEDCGGGAKAMNDDAESGSCECKEVWNVDSGPNTACGYVTSTGYWQRFFWVYAGSRYKCEKMAESKGKQYYHYAPGRTEVKRIRDCQVFDVCPSTGRYRMTNSRIYRKP